jgi:hypothetical protein
MTKRKTGLHRKVSSIFDGVSVPKSTPAKSDESAGGRTDAPKAGEPSQEQSDFMPKDVPASPKRPPHGFVKEVSSRRGPMPSRPTEFGSLGPVSVIGEKRRKATMVLMVALFVILTLVLTSTFSRRLAKKKTTSALNEATVATKAVASSSDTQIDWDIPPEYPETLRDPMETTWSQDPVTGEWIEESVVVIKDGEEQTLIDVGIALRSILWAESGRSVVVGNEILYEGDTILGVTIKKINKDSVEFEKDGVGFLKVFPR